jgi:hypothetical protein
MKTFWIEIATESPVLLADGPPAGNLTKTLDFIPGSVILGLLAHSYLCRDGKRAEDPHFEALFLEGKAFFDNGHLEGAQPIPQSARTCKYFEGFKGQKGGHGVWDLLLHPGGELRCEAPDCGKPLDYFHGGVAGKILPDGTADWQRLEVDKRVITRTAISAHFGIAASGKLYSHEVIEEGQRFIARIVAPQELESVVSELLDKPFEACIGRGRSRGQGWVRVMQCDPAGEPLNAAAERAPGFLGQDGHPLLAVTFLSDALFCDDYLRDITLPTLDHLFEDHEFKKYWEPVAADAFTETRLVSGFQGPPWNLPREPRLAVCAGSVMAFKLRYKDAEIPRLAGDGEIRVGDRTAEGFGRAVLWHPFHDHFRPKPKRTAL